MTSSTRNAYSLSVEISEAPAMVFKLLTTPKAQCFWNKDVQLLTQAPPTLQPGSSWLEGRSLLFMRQSCSVEVLDLDPSAMCVTTSLDDTYNRIHIKTCVVPHPISEHHSIITQAVECFTCAGGQLSPSEKLACMWRKSDRSLVLLRDYLQPCGTDAAAGPPTRSRNVPTAAAAPVMLAM